MNSDPSPDPERPRPPAGPRGCDAPGPQPSLTQDDSEDDFEENEDLPDAFEAPDPPAERGLPEVHPPTEREGHPLPSAHALEGCTRCGNSCRSVYLWQGDLAEFKERDTKKWTEYHEIETFTKLMPDGKTFWGIKLPKPCKHLIESAPDEFGCAVYDRRPYVCRIYKGINPDGPQPGCGFHGGPKRSRSSRLAEPVRGRDRALVLLYPGAVLQEVMLASDMLAGHMVVEFATPTQEAHRDASGLRILPDLDYVAVDPARYRCVLVPGGDPTSIMENAEVDRILRAAVQDEAVVAGICAGNLVLAKAGVLRGRRIVHNYRAPWASEEIESFSAPYWEGALVDPDPQRLLARDGKVVTALPNGHVDFALAVTQALDLHSQDEVTFLKSYHKGQAGPNVRST